MISLTYIGLIDLCVFVVRSTPSLGGMYLRIHFTHQTGESQKPCIILLLVHKLVQKERATKPQTTDDRLLTPNPTNKLFAANPSYFP
ncbi:MAG: hypothetical protein EWV60_08915 [Microcystis sp. Msp_OC_L_20101000_S702]|nr:MAG: hypothetical protein EWV60_08915 [Microcystis sp. Msp_OC_L_20101000_S702]